MRPAAGTGTKLKVSRPKPRHDGTCSLLASANASRALSRTGPSRVAAPTITTVAFDHTGKHLAVGDKAGRISLFQSDHPAELHQVIPA